MGRTLWLLALCLVGCGSALDQPAAAPVGPVRARESRQLMLHLKAGWNSVGFRCSQLLQVAPNPALAGMAWWDGQGYRTGQVSAAALNQAGPGRAFWVYATEATVLEYSGEEGEPGEVRALRVGAGWNLIAFPEPLRELDCLEGPDLVLGTLFAADPRNGNVEFRSAPSIQAGIGYWLYSTRAATLRYCMGAVLAPSPSPPGLASPSPNSPPTPAPSAAASPGGPPSSPSPTPDPGRPPVGQESPTVVTAGEQFTLEFRVDAAVSVPVSLTLHDAPEGTELSGSLQVDSDPLTGVVRFEGLSLNRTGTVRLRALAGSVGMLSGLLRVLPGPATRLAFGVQPADTAANSPFAVSVQVTDEAGNPVVPPEPLAITLNTGDPTLSGPTATTDSDGEAWFPSLTQISPGSYVLTANAPGYPSLASLPFTVSP